MPKNIEKEKEDLPMIQTIQLLQLCKKCTFTLFQGRPIFSLSFFLAQLSQIGLGPPPPPLMGRLIGGNLADVKKSAACFFFFYFCLSCIILCFLHHHQHYSLLLSKNLTARLPTVTLQLNNTQSEMCQRRAEEMKKTIALQPFTCCTCNTEKEDDEEENN